MICVEADQTILEKTLRCFNDAWAVWGLASSCMNQASLNCPWVSFLSQVTMKLVKNSDIMLAVDGNGVPIFFEPVRSQQNVLCIEGHKRCDVRTFEVLLTDFFWATFRRNLEKVAEKKSVRSTSKVWTSLRLWPSMQRTFCWDLTGSKKMGTPLPSTASIISLFLTSFMVTWLKKLTQGQLRLAWFMQDGARPHTAHASLKHLRVFSRIV